MAEEKSLINFGDLSKPVTLLIEKVSKAVGVLYEPTRIVKKAKANAKAEKIKLMASIELSEIQQRAIDRMVYQEERKQRNIESITAQAAALLGDNSEVENLSEDWVAYFFKNCDIVSDKEMQSLWSRLLSGEAAKSGTFSRKTIDIVASMNKVDAEYFSELCGFGLQIDGSEIIPVVFDYNREVYKNQGANFGNLLHLESLGLINFEGVSGYKWEADCNCLKISYFDVLLEIEFVSGGNNSLEVGKVLLTRSGVELANICGATKKDKFIDYLIEEWSARGLKVRSL